MSRFIKLSFRFRTYYKMREWVNLDPHSFFKQMLNEEVKVFEKDTGYDLEFQLLPELRDSADEEIIVIRDD